MLPTTGVIAVFLIFLAGPYYTFQGKWPKRWGHRLSVEAHSNVSILVAIAVFVHVALKFNQLGPIVGWVATGFFILTVVSGFYGMHIAKEPAARARWMKRQGIFACVFYASLVPHLILEAIGLPLVFAVGIGWATWRWRSRVREKVSLLKWPYSHLSQRCIVASISRDNA
jgi:uncharacterized membrane protein YozB (DUF420 family)